jgi:hypothetical protein
MSVFIMALFKVLRDLPAFGLKVKVVVAPFVAVLGSWLHPPSADVQAHDTIQEDEDLKRLCP